MKRLSLALTSITLFILSSCATTNPRLVCETKDWSEVGLRDAYRLRDVDYRERYPKLCGEGVLNKVEYTNGYEKEIKRYCTKEDAFVFGYLQKKPNPFCPSSPELKAAYGDGLLYPGEVDTATRLRKERDDEAEARRKESLLHPLARATFPSGFPDRDYDEEIRVAEERQKLMRETYVTAIQRAHSLQSLSWGTKE